MDTWESEFVNYYLPKEVLFSWQVVCLLAGLHKYYWFDESWSNLDPFKVWKWSRSQSGNKKNNPDFPIYLLLHALAEDCALWVL